MSGSEDGENDGEWEYVTEDENEATSEDEKDKKKKINHFNEGLKKWKESKARAGNDGNVWDSWGEKESASTRKSYTRRPRASEDAESIEEECDQDQGKVDGKKKKEGNL